MQERQAELDRQGAQAAVGTSDGSFDSRVLDKLTEQITQRLQVPLAHPQAAHHPRESARALPSADAAPALLLPSRVRREACGRLIAPVSPAAQVEVRRETALAMQKGEVGGQVERFLEGHIATNTCPICFELMSGKAHQPMLLFPCGHTFCAGCLHTHLRQKPAGNSTCPFCRTVIGSHAVNVSLQQVIDGFVDKQRRLERGEDVFGAAVAAGGATGGVGKGSAACGAGCGSCGAACGVQGEAERYAQQFRAFSLRCTVLANQQAEARLEAQRAAEQSGTAAAVLAHLATEEASAEARLRQAQVELEVAREQRCTQQAKCAGLRAKEAEMTRQAELIEQTLGPLHTEKDKARLLVRSLDPHLAARLGEG